MKSWKTQSANCPRRSQTAAGAARRKDTGTSDKTAYPEGTDAPALHQRGYAGKFPDKAGSADGR